MTQTPEPVSEEGFGEVFGIARSCSGNCDVLEKEKRAIIARLKKEGRLPEGRGLTDDQELNAIWQKMLDEIEKEKARQAQKSK